MAGWGSGEWGGGSEWGLALGEETVIAERAAGITEVNVFGLDLLEVVFGVPIRVDPGACLSCNWRIDLLSEEGRPVTVREVRTDAGPSIDRLYLVLSPMTLGAFYSVTQTGTIKSIQNEILTGNMQEIFKGRLTKADSLARSRPAMYDLRPEAAFRNILNAIGRSDDQIGGSQKDGEDILPELPPI